MLESSLVTSRTPASVTKSRTIGRAKYGEHNRCRQMKRWLDLIIALSRRAYAIGEIAEKLGVSVKTARRDIRALEEVGLPIYTDRVSDLALDHSKVWRIDPHWMTKFVKSGAL